MFSFQHNKACRNRSQKGMNPLPKTALETGVAMEKNMVAVAVNNGYGLALYDPEKNRWLALDRTGPKLTAIPTVCLLYTSYMLVLGEKESEANTVAVRDRATDKTTTMSMDEFCAKLETEIKERL